MLKKLALSDIIHVRMQKITAANLNNALLRLAAVTITHKYILTTDDQF